MATPALAARFCNGDPVHSTPKFHSMLLLAMSPLLSPWVPPGTRPCDVRTLSLKTSSSYYCAMRADWVNENHHRFVASPLPHLIRSPAALRASGTRPSLCFDVDGEFPALEGRSTSVRARHRSHGTLVLLVVILFPRREISERERRKHPRRGTGRCQARGRAIRYPTPYHQGILD